MLSASANKLGNLKMHADGYASLIMEELDPDHNGYIEVRSEKFLLLSNFIEFYINLHLLYS